MDAPSQLPPPPRPDVSRLRRSHPLLSALGVAALVVVYVAGLAVMSEGDPGSPPPSVVPPPGVVPIGICQRTDALLSDIDATNLDDGKRPPADLVPADLAAAFPGSALLPARVLLDSADVVRETIPEAGPWHVELDRQDFVIGWVQSFSFRGLELTVKLEELGSHRQANAYANWLARNVNCRYSNEVWGGSVSGSLGFQIRYRSGNITEQLTFVRGAYRYTVAVNGPDAPSDHSLVERLAREVVRVDQR